MPGPGISPSDCLAVIGGDCRQAGFSERAADLIGRSHRDSTRQCYNSRLAGFCEWCRTRGVNPRSAPVSAVADFLVAQFDKGRALSTVRGYRSAIAAVHRGFADGSTVSNSLELSRLSRAFMLERPPVKRLLPPWSLPRVLRVLAGPPFEPMAKASLLHLTMKTVFLVAIASGQRRSTLHALSTASGHIRWEPTSVRLVPKAGFIAKNQFALADGVEVVLRSLTDFSSVREDRLWCPVRALKRYVDRTRPLRSDDQLFLISREPFSPASRDTISRWIVDTIQAAGPSVLIDDLAASVRPRAHDTRGVSASWALFQGVPLKEIQRAASWASSNTFTSCYLRDVLAGEGSFSGAAIAAAAPAAR